MVFVDVSDDCNVHLKNHKPSSSVYVCVIIIIIFFSWWFVAGRDDGEMSGFLSFRKRSDIAEGP